MVNCLIRKFENARITLFTLLAASAGFLMAYSSTLNVEAISSSETRAVFELRRASALAYNSSTQWDASQSVVGLYGLLAEL
jgi:hypothetical protein